MEDSMQQQRFERKYYVTERQALQLRECIKAYLVPDKFSENKPDYSYPVHSLYLDSNELLTYWATVHCEKSRFKLRVRYYNDDPEAPLFFEIKRRENECVMKQRGIVHRAAGARLLAGELPGLEHLVGGKAHHLGALQRFCHLMQQLRAKPMVHVAYLREAWGSAQGNSTRVTIDRQVRGEPRCESIFNTQMQKPVYPFGTQRVLELKFTDRFPDWLGDLVRHFNLQQTGAAKYCGCLVESGEHQVVENRPDQLQQKLAEVLRFC
jgi:hypothetical protein